MEKITKVKDLDFDLIYVYRYDTATDGWTFWAFHYEENAKEFMMMDEAEMNGEPVPGVEGRYQYGYVNGDFEVMIVEE